MNHADDFRLKVRVMRQGICGIPGLFRQTGSQVDHGANLACQDTYRAVLSESNLRNKASKLEPSTM